MTHDARAVARSLRDERTVDIVTTGRLSGVPRTTEIWTTVIDGTVHLCGTPGAVGSVGEAPRVRDWLRNLRADPRLTVRLKTSVAADLRFEAEEVTDSECRRDLYDRPETAWYRERADLDDLVEHAPLVRLHPADDRTRAVLAELARLG